MQVRIVEAGKRYRVQINRFGFWLDYKAVDTPDLQYAHIVLFDTAEDAREFIAERWQYAFRVVDSYEIV